MTKKDIVYTITNLINKRVYVGVTTREGELRLHEHWLDLVNGRERNKDLQNEFVQYGEKSFSFEIIFETYERLFCELVLIELLSRVGLGFKQKRGIDIQKVINGEKLVPEVVFREVENYLIQYHSTSELLNEMLEELQDMKSGFRCKNKDVYNREFKNEFLKGYSRDTRRSVENIFKKSNYFERKWGKDLYNFTFDEAEEVLFSLKAKTLRSLQNHISKLNKYLEFAIQEKNIINMSNYYKGLGDRERCSKYLLFNSLKHNKQVRG